MSSCHIVVIKTDNLLPFLMWHNPCFLTDKFKIDPDVSGLKLIKYKNGKNYWN
jgi:hypothetical protein